MAKDSNQLPSKEQALFRSVIRFYETKQYKKGVKAADQILKKFPEHGETLCMKGLTVSFLGSRKEEAYELVRKGLKFDMRSHVCWHVYGLLYRQDREYIEAVKCYRQALRIDGENIQILRDLSLLQIHTRDLPGFCETRQRLLMTKSAAKMHWLGYCVAAHLKGDLDLACVIMDQYLATFHDNKSMVPYEISELYLYKAAMLEEMGKYEDAEKIMNGEVKSIVDRVGHLEAQARLAFRLGKHADAKVAMEKLLAKIPENTGYALALLSTDDKARAFWPAPHEPGCCTASFPSAVVKPGCGGANPWLGKSTTVKGGWATVGKLTRKCRVATHRPCRALTDEEEEYVCTFFDALKEQHPKSEALHFLPIFFCTGARLRARLDTFLQPRLRKGIPALFSVVKPLYYIEGRAAVLDELLRSYIKTLTAPVSTFDGKKEEPPTSLTFTQMFLAQHLDMQGEWDEAVQVMDNALADTPTLPDLCTCKARILKHMGDLEQSSELLNTAREMDLADRFLNTMAVRGLMRKDETDEALKTVLLFDFYSKDAPNREEGNLFDMQVMWVEYYIGLSFKRQGEWGKALKKFNDTIKHFQDIQEDQFDFHSYCFRKTTLRTYVRFLRMQDELYSHKFYRRAAKAAMQIYQHLWDNPVVTAKEETADAEANLSAAEKKALKLKQKREAKKKEEKPEEKTEEKGKGGRPGRKDDDPKGEKLVVPEKVDEDALAIVRQLSKHCSLDPMTYKFSYYVHQRRGKLLQCVQALIRLWRLGGQDGLMPKLAPLLSHFAFKGGLENADERVQKVALAQLSALLDAGKLGSVKDLRAAAEKWLDRVEGRLARPLRLAEQMHYCSALVHAGRKDKLAKHVGGVQITRANPLKECEKMLGFLGSVDPALQEQLKQKCLAAFPRARRFKEALAFAPADRK